MDWTWLVVLMCPLMMLPMMYFMMKGNHSEKSGKDHHKNLSEELEQLKKQNEFMQKELRELKSNG